MKKRLVQSSITMLLAVALLFGAVMGSTSYVEIDEEPVALSGEPGTVIQQTEDDLNVIPDKYNTGAKGELMQVGLGDKVGDIQFTAGSGGTKNTLDFYYRNRTVEGMVTIENCDFSGYSVALYNADKVDRKIKVIFNNCRFMIFSSSRTDGNISFEFNDCTFNNFGGSNAVFNRCKFGNSTADGINPFGNIEVNDSFISDLGSESAAGKVVHSDGMQMYGSEGTDVKNVIFRNCRFEIPPLSQEGSTASVNACIMLQMEFSNAENVSFSDCIVNGGGYSIFARSTNEKYSLTNVSMDGIRVGCAKAYGTFYPRISSSVAFDNITETDN